MYLGGFGGGKPPTSAVAVAASGTTALAYTGVNVLLYLAVAAALIAAGVVLLGVTKRRNARTR